MHMMHDGHGHGHGHEDEREREHQQRSGTSHRILAKLECVMCVTYPPSPSPSHASGDGCSVQIDFPPEAEGEALSAFNCDADQTHR